MSQEQLTGIAIISISHSIGEQILVCVPLHGNFELRPLGVAMGNAVSVARV